MTLYMLSLSNGATIPHLFTGLGLGLGLSFLWISFDTFLKKFNLRAFNTTLLGLFIGYLMGQALLLIFNMILELISYANPIEPQNIAMVKMIIFLFGSYLGTIMTLRSSDELCMSIPFIKFEPVGHKRKELLVDLSALSDPRILDLSTSGILDHQLLIPRFILKELHTQSETGEELLKAKARKSLEIIKKLEAIPSLHLQYNEANFPEIRDPQAKYTSLAKLLNCNILSSDLSRPQTTDGVRTINIHTLAHALKPLMQTAEQLKIKIQRVGKEPKQGIGYLDDGTMVVINGGGDFIGEIIEAQVLSVKTTSAGRMIFCNAQNEENSDDYAEEYHNR